MAEGRIRVSVSFADGTLATFLPLGALEAWLETRDFDLGDPSQEKFLELLLVEVRELSQIVNLTIQLGLKDRLTDDITWTNEFLVSGNAPIWLPEVPSTRYARLRLRDTSVSGVWKLSALELWGQKDGGRM